MGLAVHLRQLRLQFGLHGVNLFFQSIHGNVFFGLLLARFFTRRIIPHLMHECDGHFIQLPLYRADLFLIFRDDGTCNSHTDQKRNNRHNDRRPGQRGQLLIVPFRAEIHGNNPRHLAMRIQNGAVCAVEGAPRILIRRFICGRRTQAGLVQSLRIHDRRTEFPGILHRGIQAERKCSVAHIPNTVDVL